jgi:hypothetical protein
MKSKNRENNIVAVRVNGVYSVDFDFDIELNVPKNPEGTYINFKEINGNYLGLRAYGRNESFFLANGNKRGHYNLRWIKFSNKVPVSEGPFI